MTAPFSTLANLRSMDEYQGFKEDYEFKTNEKCVTGLVVLLGSVNCRETMKKLKLLPLILAEKEDEVVFGSSQKIRINGVVFIRFGSKANSSLGRFVNDFFAEKLIKKDDTAAV